MFSLCGVVVYKLAVLYKLEAQRGNKLSLIGKIMGIIPLGGTKWSDLESRSVPCDPPTPPSMNNEA